MDNRRPKGDNSNHLYLQDLFRGPRKALTTNAKAVKLNPHMKEVVRAEVIKLLDVGIIYPISDS